MCACVCVRCVRVCPCLYVYVREKDKLPSLDNCMNESVRMSEKKRSVEVCEFIPKCECLSHSVCSKCLNVYPCLCVYVSAL